MAGSDDYFVTLGPAPPQPPGPPVRMPAREPAPSATPPAAVPVQPGPPAVAGGPALPPPVTPAGWGAAAPGPGSAGGAPPSGAVWPKVVLAFLLLCGVGSCLDSDESSYTSDTYSRDDYSSDDYSGCDRAEAEYVVRELAEGYGGYEVDGTPITEETIEDAVDAWCAARE